MKKFFIFACVLSACICFISCSRKNDVLPLDNSDPLALQPGVEWALVISPYASCHEKAGYDEAVSEHLRRGEIRMVEGQQTVKVDDVIEQWYSVKEGWITGSDLNIFSNKLKAEKAQKSIK